MNDNNVIFVVDKNEEGDFLSDISIIKKKK